jgi:hypothetical protein
VLAQGNAGAVAQYQAQLAGGQPGANTTGFSPQLLGSAGASPFTASAPGCLWMQAKYSP